MSKSIFIALNSDFTVIIITCINNGCDNNVVLFPPEDGFT
jgi:hypothetical protein